MAKTVQKQVLNFADGLKEAGRARKDGRNWAGRTRLWASGLRPVSSHIG